MENKSPKYYAKIDFGTRRPFWVLTNYMGDKGKHEYFTGIIIDESHVGYGKPIEFPASAVIKWNQGRPAGLGSPYIPATETCTILDTIVPDSMDYETHISIRKIKEAVGGSLTDFVCKKLKYTRDEMCRALAAEQVDAVAMAIYNIEYRNQGMIVGDQTGIGKGRVAAAMIRYGHLAGHQPIFLSEKPNLFSDIYRDLSDIGSSNLVPFIVNSKETKTDVKDVNGNIVYQALPITEQQAMFKSKKLPGRFNYVLATYSQFNSPDRKTVKPDFLNAIAEGNILIMDEAHNASGSSNTGEYLQNLIRSCKGVVFLSATFAKRPDNMPIYAMKTAMSEANMTRDQLVEAITRGGVALQEVLSSQLVYEGQMLRRERSFDGVEVNYLTLNDFETEHKAISDNITNIIRQIIAFQGDHVDKVIDGMDEVYAAEGKEIKERGGTAKGGVDNSPYFSKVFNVINQMLFAIKASAVADRAIQRLKEGKKPIIAFSSTMGSFLESMENERGNVVSDGDVINADFKTVLLRGLQGVMRYTEKDQAGEAAYKQLSLDELTESGKSTYQSIVDQINEASTGIVISPIDLVIQKIVAAGYSVSEVTGRKLSVQFNDKKTTKGLSTVGMVMTRKRENVNDAFRKFNNNEVDVLMINQSGSTGASAHAIITDAVSRDRVKQRVMIILQTDLNINTEVQKRGRINRTGQIYKPIYDYVSSAIPAERRLMMMMKKKLKSLDANTTSNQKQSDNQVSSDDFLNKYGDQVVHEYLMSNLELNKDLDDPLDLDGDNKDGREIKENLAAKVSGRVAVLSTERQEAFYRDIVQGYNDKVEYLVQTGDYDLEVQTMNLEAETIEAKSDIVGKGGDSIFGTDSVLEKCMCNVLKKPFTKIELENLLRESLADQSAETIKNDLKKAHKQHSDRKLQDDIEAVNVKYRRLIDEITKEKGYKKLINEPVLAEEYIRARSEALTAAQDEQIDREKQISASRFHSLNNHFEYFTIGEGYVFPFVSFDMGEIQVPSIFLGFAVDQSRSNPFAPSSVKARFALADSHKYITLVCSGDQGQKMLAIKGSTSPWMTKNYLTNWDELIKKSSVNRSVRFIITGNILQAAPKYKGNLISYTTIDGGVKKGILMPENWSNENIRGESFITIPIKKAKDIILSINEGDSIATTNSIIFENPYSRYYSPNRQAIIKMIVPKNSVYGPIYKDAEIMRLSTNPDDGFIMVSGKMVASFTVENLSNVIDILQNKFTLSVKVNPKDYDLKIEINSGDTHKDVKTIKAEIDFAKDKDKFEKRKFDEKQHQAKPPVVNASLELLKAKAKARLRLLILKNRGIKI
jgi:hypothetical protein